MGREIEKARRDIKERLDEGNMLESKAVFELCIFHISGIFHLVLLLEIATSSYSPTRGLRPVYCAREGSRSRTRRVGSDC